MESKNERGVGGERERERECVCVCVCVCVRARARARARACTLGERERVKKRMGCRKMCVWSGGASDKNVQHRNGKILTRSIAPLN